MKIVELEKNGTILLDKFGNADFLTGIKAEKQIINNALQQFKTSWFEDTNVGVDWFAILGKQFNLNTIKSEISRVLLSLDFVLDIVNINLGSVDKNRKTELSFVLNTKSGNTIKFSEVL